METKIYVELKNPINSGGGSILNELRIKVDYQKGGVNYFSGNYSDSGVYVFLTPVRRGNGFESFTITGSQHTSGYKILLKQINRKSQKQIELAAAKVLPYAQQIADLYSDVKHQDVYNLIKSIIGT
jgi:hypothetical protein